MGVTEDYGVDLSECQVMSLSQSEMLLDFDCLATNVSNQSFLIMPSSKHLSVVFHPVSVSKAVNSDIHIKLYEYMQAKVTEV